ncbi:MAG TPA: HAMP domain-containing sensor histidine kinase [Trichocoleus sp.]
MNQNYPSLSSLLASEALQFRNFGSELAAMDAQSRSSSDRTQCRLQAEADWWAAIAALTHLLHLYSQPSDTAMAEAPETRLAAWEGLVLAGPLPVLWDQSLVQRLSTWVLLPEPLEGLLAVARPLLPDDGSGQGRQSEALQTIPLPVGDSLAAERFCLVLTSAFSLSLVMGSDPQGRAQFQFSFDPETNEQVWGQLRSRIAQIRPPLLPTVDKVAEQFPRSVPDYRAVTQFTRLLLAQVRQQASSGSGSETSSTPETGHGAANSAVRLLALESPGTLDGYRQHVEEVLYRENPPLGLPQTAGTNRSKRVAKDADPTATSSSIGSNDAELLKAMAHEIRTPLTTIRTLTRSLLKRKDLPEAVVQRLQLMDRECTQQIDRFNLIFRAVELETDGSRQPKSPLSAISLSQIFQDSIPLWQQQAERRNLTLEVKVPAQMPMVTSDPTMLNQVLTGLIDRFTHSLPPYSHIRLMVSLAGHQLKLQFQSQPKSDSSASATCQQASVSPFRSVGQLLMFQPETGGLSLNLDATKNLFQALGGKLIVRHKPQRGEVLTVYLPLETRSL